MARPKDIELLNWVVNQPEVLREMAPRYESVDLQAFFRNSRNQMFGDDRGLVIFGEKAPGIFEMHYLFTFALRGKKALQLLRNSIDVMFNEHGATVICGATPRENLAARLINRALGGRPTGVNTDSSGRPCIIYQLERASWVTSSAESSGASAASSVETIKKKPTRPRRSKP